MAKAWAGGTEAFLGRLIRKEEMCAMPQVADFSRPAASQGRESSLFCKGSFMRIWNGSLICSGQAGSIRVLDDQYTPYRLSRQGSVMNATGLERHVGSLMTAARTLMGESQEYDKIRQKFCCRAAGLCLFMAMEYAFRQGENRAKELEKEIRADLLLIPALRYLPRKYLLYCLLGRGLTGGIRLYYR